MDVAEGEKSEPARAELEDMPPALALSADKSWDAQKVATEYAKIAIQSAFLVNGGALVALPPLMQWLPDEQRSYVPICAGLFVIGLLAAALSALAWYLHFVYQAEAFNLPPNRRTHEDPIRNANRKISAARFVAVSIGIASYLCFVIGTYLFVGLSMSAQPEP